MVTPLSTSQPLVERTPRDETAAGPADELGQARRSVRVLRRRIVGLIVLVVVVALVGAGLVAAQGRAVADSATAARAAALTTTAAALAGSQQDLAGLLALAADRVHPSAAAGSAVVAAANRTPDLQRVVSLGGVGATTTAISTDGQAEAVVTPGGHVAAYALQSGHRLGELVVHGTGADTPIAVSAAGRYLAVATSSGIRVLDTRSGHAVAAAASTPSALAFLPDDTLAEIDPGGAPVFVDPTSGAKIPLPAIPGQGTASVTADGRTEIWTEQSTVQDANPFSEHFADPETRIVDVASGKQVGAPIAGLLTGMTSDGRRLAILVGARLSIIDSASRSVIRTIDVGSTLTADQVSDLVPGAAVAFDASGTSVAYEGTDAGAPLHVVDVATGDARTEPVPLSHRNAVPAFDADGHLIASTPTGAAVFTAPTETPARTAPRAIARQEYNPTPLAFVATDATGSRTVEVIPPSAANGPDRYRVTSATTPGAGPVLTPDSGHRFDEATAAFSTDGRLVAALEWSPSSTTGTEIVVWDARTGSRIAAVGDLPTVPPNEEALQISRLAFLGDTELAATTPSSRPDTTGESPTELDVWRVGAAPGSPIAHADLGEASTTAFSTDGGRVATQSISGLGLWSTRTGQPLASSQISDTTIFSELRFSADGTVLVGGASASEVARWRVPRLDARRQVSLPSAPIDHGWAISPDGSTVADIGPSSIEFRSSTTGRVEGRSASSSASDELLGFTRDGGAVVVWDGSRLELVDRSGDVAELGGARTAPPTTVLDDDPDMVASRTGVLTAVTSGTQVDVQAYVTTAAAAAQRVCAVAGRDLTPTEWARYLPGATPVALCGAARKG